jgi:hypothetical protein
MHNRYVEAKLSSSFVFDKINIYPDADNKEKQKIIIIEEAFKPPISNKCCNIS